MSNEYSSRGVGNAGLTTGIIGTAGWLLNGGLGNILGGGQAACNENMPVNRYEMGLQQENARLRTEVELHKAEIYTDNKFEKLNDRYECRFNKIESQIAQQAVHNATSDGLMGCMAQQIAALQGLTKLIVPATSVCPAPMPQYNSWTAPTTTTTGT
jgi:hypothetical protein